MSFEKYYINITMKNILRGGASLYFKINTIVGPKIVDWQQLKLLNTSIIKYCQVSDSESARHKA